MNKQNYQFESIPLNLNQGIIRVTWEDMPSNLVNQIVAVWSSHKEVLAITVDWREERKAILKACPLIDPVVFFCDHFHIDTWDKKIDNSEHKAQNLAAVDLLVAALEGGSNHWFEKIKFVSNPLEGELTYDDGLAAFKNGLAYIVITEIDGENYELKRDGFIEIMKEYVFGSSYETLEDLHLSHDADDADQILQQALFGDVIYG